ncbi:MAG: terminase small subunit [Janthinobacterium lividum]
MATEQENTLSAYEKLTDRQRLFVDDYCKHGVGAKAAKQLGLKGGSAWTEAWRMLRNAEVSAAITERLGTASLGALEVTKQISDIGQTRLNDYFTLREVQGHEQEKHYLSVLKERKEAEVAYIEQFADKQGMALVNMKGPTPMGERLQKAKEQLLELELEIMTHGPDAVRLVAGKPVTYQVAELDLVKLAKAKEAGRIKSYSVGKDGLKVETYDALGALNLSARMLGLYKEDNEQSKAQIAIIEVVAPPTQQKGRQRG